jgi:endonuclease V-like protein UPF0215 family
VTKAVRLTSDLIHGPRKFTQWKKGVRVVGVAESFHRTDSWSNVVAIVMRGDFRIDGFGYCRPTVGGSDATDEIISMFKRMKRDDIRFWMLGGGIISWFNIIDNQKLFKETEIPVICVSYYESEGLEKYLKEYFPNDWKDRELAINRNGERTKMQLTNGYELYLNCTGINERDALRLVDGFTIEGRVPEPIRIARSTAASLRRDLRNYA